MMPGKGLGLDSIVVKQSFEKCMFNLDMFFCEKHS